MSSHVRVTDGWEVEEPNPVPAAANMRPTAGRETYGSLFVAAYVDDCFQIRVGHGSDDLSAPLTPQFRSCRTVLRLFEPGLRGETPISSPE